MCVFFYLCLYVYMYLYMLVIYTIKTCYNDKYKSWSNNKRDIKISVLQDP